MTKKEGFAPLDEAVLEVFREKIEGPKFDPRSSTHGFSLTEIIYAKYPKAAIELLEQNHTIQMVSRSVNEATIHSFSQQGGDNHNQIQAHSNGDLFVLLDNNKLVNITERMAELDITAASINKLVLDSAVDGRLDIIEQQEVAGLVNLAVRIAQSDTKER